jgi:asparagine synthase (glutamine-hydrolysing)
MCGICGFANFEDVRLLRKMADKIEHRGPDDYGYYNDSDVSIATRRLAIIDVDGGHQPISNEDGSIWVVFNGEIYNYRQLRSDLEKTHRFNTNSDTEVLVHAYEEFGEEFIKKLEGEFAFCIYDRNKKILMLARDRLGVKPLYYIRYCKEGSSLFFASEIKALLETGIERAVELDALKSYLSFGYVKSPLTMFQNIFKFNPATYSIYNIRDGSLTEHKYWCLKITGTETSTEKLARVIEDSVKSMLVSEVPLGVFLSGGLDSTSLVAMASFHKKPLTTVSAGFEDAECYDELKYAKIVADYFGTDHKEVIVKDSVTKILPKVVWHFDEPVLDGSAIPEFLLAKKAKKYITVALVGEGSDELFCGYRQYKIMRYLRNLPHLNIPPSLLPSKRSKKYAAAFAKFSAKKTLTTKYLSLITNFDNGSFPTAKIDKASTAEITYKGFQSQYEGDYYKQIYNYELGYPLSEMLLMNVDKMCMANSIEARVPFLNYKLVEFASKIPYPLKLKGWDEKHILRAAMKPHIPKEIFDRAKHPFSVPITRWLEGELGEMTKQLLDKDEIDRQGIFDSSKVEEIIRKDEYSKIWSLLFFQVWHKMFIEEERV